MTKVFEKAKSSDLATVDSVIDDVFPQIATSLTKDEIKTLVNGVFEYQLVDAVGFPFSFKAITHDTKGSIIVASDLSSNVSKLHEYLFDEVEYIPTDKVQEISSSIQNETGVGSE